MDNGNNGNGNGNGNGNDNDNKNASTGIETNVDEMSNNEGMNNGTSKTPAVEQEASKSVNSKAPKQDATETSTTVGEDKNDDGKYNNKTNNDNDNDDNDNDNDNDNSGSSKGEHALSTMETAVGSDDDDHNNHNKTNISSSNKDNRGSQPEEPSNNNNNNKPPSIGTRLCKIYADNEFLILVIVAILLALAYPPLGDKYLAPDITATWIAVCIIFVFAGLGLKTDEFSKAFQQIWFNSYVQVFNFGFVSVIVYVVTRGLEAANILSQDLADGMVVSACLPMTINMVLVLTKSGGGDESLAIVNSAAGNLVGVFLSPILILGYLGVTGDVNLGEVFYKLALRVVLPVAVGQAMQKTMPKVVAFYKKHKANFKRFQEFALVFIVYTVFCTTFENGSSASIGDIFLMVLFVFLFLVSFMAAAWISLGILFKNHPQMRVMGLFGCTHKTVAMGVPLINAIYGSDAAVGLYTLPLLIWHTMQLVIGTFLAPRLAFFVEREKERLGQADTSADDEEEMNLDEPATTTDLENIPASSPQSEMLKDEPSERS
ncbi:hypothetical protein ACA910_015856 [Epithemia clementina (nom. ined.)]